MQINRVLVVGAGAMGRQIAMVCALAGIDTSLSDLSQQALDDAMAELRKRMDRDVEKGRRTAADVEQALSRVTTATDASAAVVDADYVIEAAVERLDVKRALFEELSKAAPQHTILATNSSSIVSSRLADATDRPDRVCNLHFFNPALVMRCVEVVGGPHTSAETIAASVALVERLGKEAVVLHKEINGFVANRILGAVRDEALNLLEGGYAEVPDIDLACRTALGYPMGPFELMDLTGIDIGYLVRQDRYAESGDPADLPSPIVAALVERGELGRKSGVGFYRYDDQGRATPRPRNEVVPS